MKISSLFSHMLFYKESLEIFQCHLIYYWPKQLAMEFFMIFCGILRKSCRMLWILVEQSCCWNSQYPYGLLLESWKFFRDSPGILQAFFSHSSGILQEFFGDSPGIFQAFFRHSSGILQEFFMNSSGILQAFFRNSLGIFQEFFSNSSAILQAFFRHSFGTLYAFLECLNKSK